MESNRKSSALLHLRHLLLPLLHVFGYFSLPLLSLSFLHHPLPLLKEHKMCEDESEGFLIQNTNT